MEWKPFAFSVLAVIVAILLLTFLDGKIGA